MSPNNLFKNLADAALKQSSPLELVHVVRAQARVAKTALDKGNISVAQLYLDEVVEIATKLIIQMHHEVRS